MKKIVFISGRFNVIHPGHLRLLRFAKKMGDYLIVGLESDKLAKEEAYVSESLRLEGLKSNIWVDEVVLMRDSLSKTIKKIKPQVIVKGKEHEEKFNIEKKIVLKTYNICMKYFKAKSCRSLSGILQVAIVTSGEEFSCSEDCYYCPNQKGYPRSYVKEEPAIKRADEEGFDISNRLSATTMTTLYLLFISLDATDCSRCFRLFMFGFMFIGMVSALFLVTFVWSDGEYHTVLQSICVWTPELVQTVTPYIN